PGELRIAAERQIAGLPEDELFRRVAVAADQIVRLIETVLAEHRSLRRSFHRRVPGGPGSPGRGVGDRLFVPEPRGLVEELAIRFGTQTNDELGRGSGWHGGTRRSRVAGEAARSCLRSRSPNPLEESLSVLEALGRHRPVERDLTHGLEV